MLNEPAPIRNSQGASWEVHAPADECDCAPASTHTEPCEPLPPVDCLSLLRCACLPCLVTLAAGQVLCCCGCRRRAHPTWSTGFEAMVAALRVGAKNVIFNISALRLLTDPPVGVMPLCLPTLPRRVGVVANSLAPHGGEWLFPNAGCIANSGCCVHHLNDPQALDALGSPVRLILYFHGGAFALCTPKTHRDLLMRVVASTGATVLAPHYRRSPEHAWPAAIDDCLQVYSWCLSQDVPASRICFAGDSAGGGLVVAVMAAAKEAGLPLPAAGIMISPWVDMTDDCSAGSWQSNRDFDYLLPAWTKFLANAYAGTYSLRDVSVSSLELAGLPPLLVEVGELEVLRDQIESFARKAQQAGVDVELFVEEGMVHVFPLFAAVSRADSPPNTVFRHIAAFLDRVQDQDEGSGTSSETWVDSGCVSRSQVNRVIPAKGVLHRKEATQNLLSHGEDAVDQSGGQSPARRRSANLPDCCSTPSLLDLV